MTSKKYVLFMSIFCLMALYGFSQTPVAPNFYDIADSSLIPKNRLPQHSEFLAGNYNFPAKPRNQWEIGIKWGAPFVSGDIPAQFSPLGFGAHIRKAFGYVFSLRLEYNYGVAKGLQWNAAENFLKNPVWSTNGYFAPYRTTSGQVVNATKTATGYIFGNSSDAVYYNYRMKSQDLSIEGVVSFANLAFHKTQPKFNLYGFAGIGGFVYKTDVNALKGTDNTYANDFNALLRSQSSGYYSKRKDALKQLKSFLDDSYETPAESQGVRRPKLFNGVFKPSASVGIGLAYRLGNRVNIALEERYTFVKDDLLDGQRWQEHPAGDAVLTRDFDSYSFTSLGINFNIGAKNSVEPLWWVNPLNYVYSELRNPRITKRPPPPLPDSDGDGITDQFDREQTPAGCPVDNHGVSRDTDGDGIPDCKDKELITPTYCQPVDADGVGKCPVPCPGPECAPIVPPKPECAEKIGALPSIAFKSGSSKLTDDAKTLLSTVASQLRNAPGCKVVVVGYCSSSKKEQQMSWDHVNTVINHLVDKEGISLDRFIFNYGQPDGDCNTVDIRAAAEGEDGPNTVPRPPGAHLPNN